MKNAMTISLAHYTQITGKRNCRRVVIPFLNQDGNEKASEQRRDSTKKYDEEPHSAAAEVNA